MKTQTELKTSLTIRPARIGDLDDLVELENESFATDRISRRSFRHYLGLNTYVCLLATTGEGAAESAVGYGLLSFRKGTAMARLYSLCVSPRARGVGLGRALLDALEDAAFDRERLIIRLEVSENNPVAIALYEKAGYRRFGVHPDYYEDGSTAIRYEKWLRGDVDVRTDTPYYQQSTDFTCGPCCLLMALRRYNSKESEWWTKPGPQLEVRLWRESTTVFMTSGIGGCEPFGMAVAAAEYGLAPEIYISTRRSPDQLLFLDSVRSVEKRHVMTLAQQDFRDRAVALGVPVHRRGLNAAAVAQHTAEGRVVLVLLSGYSMFGQRVPHWVLAHGASGRHVMIHDPWVEVQRETQSDAANVPIPFAAFDRMSRYGRSGLRAAVVVGPKGDAQ